MSSNIKLSGLDIIILYKNQKKNLNKAKKKDIGVLLLSKSGNIKKEGLKIKELAKGD